MRWGIFGCMQKIVVVPLSRRDLLMFLGPVALSQLASASPEVRAQTRCDHGSPT
jgi:hypothetical protein